MFARLRCLLLVVVAIATAPAFSHAQQTIASRSAPAAGPRREMTATAARQTTRAADTTAMQRRSQRQSKPVALMIVGGAAILVGAFIGDSVGTVFMIGGAIALLVGLYQYLQ
jgi:cobalamin biosynthesis Mg chelatase CobN